MICALHVSAIYGDYVPDLVDVCWRSGIRPVVLKPPAGPDA